jgi:DNA polymerase
MTLRLDLETVSVVDLRRTGVYRYAEDPTTDVILACFKRGDGPIKTWRPGMPVPQEIIDAVESGESIVAWNAQFESALWFGVLGPRYGWPLPKHEQFDCSMARAMYWGYPGGLDLVAEAMDLKQRKDKDGHALMLRMCRPRRFEEDGTPVWWHATDPEKYDRLNAYCIEDVVVEEAIATRLPPLPPYERQLWLLNEKMNRRGMPVDMNLVGELERVVRGGEALSKARMMKVTGNKVSGPNAIQNLALWLQSQGVRLPNLKKDTLKAAVATLPPGPARDAIQIRMDGAKTSVSKLKAFREAVCSDGLVRGMVRYYGASRTGRYSGAGGAKVQPHNITKPTIKRPDQAIAMIEGGAGPEDLEMLFEDSALGVASSCLRGVFACR